MRARIRPLTAAEYKRAADRAHSLADAIVCWSSIAQPTAREKQRLTRAIHDLSMHCRRLSERHRAMRYVDVLTEEDRE